MGFGCGAGGDGEGRLGKVVAVKLAGDVEGSGEVAGASGEAVVGRTGRTAGSHDFEACERSDGTDENAAGLAVRFGDDIEAVVDAVVEIDVRVAGWSEDHAGSFGEPGG